MTHTLQRKEREHDVLDAFLDVLPGEALCTAVLQVGRVRVAR